MEDTGKVLGVCKLKPNDYQELVSFRYDIDFRRTLEYIHLDQGSDTTFITRKNSSIDDITTWRGLPYTQKDMAKPLRLNAKCVVANAILIEVVSNFILALNYIRKNPSYDLFSRIPKIGYSYNPRQCIYQRRETELKRLVSGLQRIVNSLNGVMQWAHRFSGYQGLPEQGSRSYARQ
jgi:hypothetical protein